MVAAELFGDDVTPDDVTMTYTVDNGVPVATATVPGDRSEPSDAEINNAIQNQITLASFLGQVTTTTVTYTVLTPENATTNVVDNYDNQWKTALSMALVGNTSLVNSITTTYTYDNDSNPVVTFTVPGDYVDQITNVAFPHNFVVRLNEQPSLANYLGISGTTTT
eukprot:UN30576